MNAISYNDTILGLTITKPTIHDVHNIVPVLEKLNVQKNVNINLIGDKGYKLRENDDKKTVKPKKIRNSILDDEIFTDSFEESDIEKLNAIMISKSKKDTKIKNILKRVSKDNKKVATYLKKPIKNTALIKYVNKTINSDIKEIKKKLQIINQNRQKKRKKKFHLHLKNLLKKILIQP